MSPQELLAAAQGLSGAGIGRLRGIHMSRKMERVGELQFVQPGEEFNLR